MRQDACQRTFALCFYFPTGLEILACPKRFRHGNHKPILSLSLKTQKHFRACATCHHRHVISRKSDSPRHWVRNCSWAKNRVYYFGTEYWDTNGRHDRRRTLSRGEPGANSGLMSKSQFLKRHTPLVRRVRGIYWGNKFASLLHFSWRQLVGPIQLERSAAAGRSLICHTNHASPKKTSDWRWTSKDTTCPHYLHRTTRRKVKRGFKFKNWLGRRLKLSKTN